MEVKLAFLISFCKGKISSLSGELSQNELLIDQVMELVWARAGPLLG